MFKNNFLASYLEIAPVPLAIERSWECDILSKQHFEGPILDIGCGEGIFSYNLFNGSKNIDLGVDPNKQELERAMTYPLYDELLECYGDKIPRGDATFKTIFSNSVLEHIEDVELVLQEAKRVLRRDGVMYLTLPTDKFDKYTILNQLFSFLCLYRLAGVWRKFFNNFWSHFHYYSPDEWAKMFNKNGMQVIEKIEYGTKLQCILNDLMTPFCLPAFLVKKATNRWFFFPKIRKFLSKKLYYMLWENISVTKQLGPGKGGLVFFKLKKNAEFNF